MSITEAFYGFDQKPFVTEGEQGPVLATEPLRALAPVLLQDLEAGAACVTIDGPRGVGKTSLARAMPRLLASTTRVASIMDCSPCWEGILRTISHAFELDGGISSRETLSQARRDRGRLVVVVDDAEEVSGETLGRLGALSQLRWNDHEPLVQLILIANLDAARRQGRCPIAAWIDPRHLHALQPLSEQAVRRYVETRLKRAGWRAGALFTSDAMRALHRASEGNPRRLSALCLEVLDQGARLSRSSLDSALVREVEGQRSARISPSRREADGPLFRAVELVRDAARLGQPLSSESVPRAEIAVAPWRPGATLLVGNSPGGDRPAEDEVPLLQVAARAPLEQAPSSGARLVWVALFATIVAVLLYAGRAQIDSLWQRLATALPASATESTLEHSPEPTSELTAAPLDGSGRGGLGGGARGALALALGSPVGHVDDARRR